MEVLSQIELSKWVHMDLCGLVQIEYQEKNEVLFFLEIISLNEDKFGVLHKLLQSFNEVSK